MIGIIIVTHGNLALELKSAMEHILGIQKNIEIISIKPDDDLEIKKSALEESIKKVDEEKWSYNFNRHVWWSSFKFSYISPENRKS